MVRESLHTTLWNQRTLKGSTLSHFNHFMCNTSKGSATTTFILKLYREGPLAYLEILT